MSDEAVPAQVSRSKRQAGDDVDVDQQRHCATGPRLLLWRQSIGKAGPSLWECHKRDRTGPPISRGLK
uniref:Uncharacterized protein n=1 Tax=Oryza meridionalis TaxID=40149 RepID=A0A0E0DPC0_9ORYZ